MVRTPDAGRHDPVESATIPTPSPSPGQAPEAGEPDMTGHWVARARAGDMDAFEALYRSHGGRVFALCLRMAGSCATAEELAQDIWVRAWEKLGTFRGESAFTTWLHRLAVNEILGRRRSDGRRAARFESVAEVSAIVEGPGRPGAPSTPEAPAGLRLDLERAIATLPEGARTVFVLYDVEGYRHREIADQLGVAEGTVKAQLHRARRMLREALQR
jgi:RNA polymerase sigma-70 factor, ECF subfamily